MLIRDGFKNATHYLIYGDSTLLPGIQMAVSDDLIKWRTLPGIFIQTRKDKFDSELVESGPYPSLLSDGNYLFIYNSARCCYPSDKPDWKLQYNVGWAILDGNDPTKILARSEDPILSPDLDWEIGNAPQLRLTPNVVFLEGWRPIPEKKDSFLVFYGGADSVIGAATIQVTIK